MEELIDSVRRIISKWTATRIPISSNINPGDTTINARSTIRLRAGDEIMFRTATQGETPVVVDEIVDDTHFAITSPARFQWTVGSNALIEKTFNQMYVQSIYVGEPVNIPRYPAITVAPVSRDSDWLTIDSTKEVYNLKISIYVEESTQEAGVRFLLKMVDNIQYGLKQNIYPLVSPYDTVALSADAATGDNFIRVADTSIFQYLSRIFIEDPYKTEEKRVMEIIDANTLEVAPTVCEPYLVSDGTQVINVRRFIFNSWPAHIDYGTIYKDTLLKAATIEWFAWEEELQNQPPIDVHLW